jgi:hypothetical protein
MSRNSEPAPGAEAEPVQFTSISISAFGVRMRADGRTGWEAWKLLRKRHPWLVRVLAGYVGFLLLVVALLAVAAAS